MRRAVVLTALPLLLATGCGAPPHPEVTFHADGKTVVVPPTQYCDLDSENCDVDPSAAGVLRVRPGKPVQISVPAQLADSVWAVAFTYRDAAGVTQEPMRSKVFTPNNPQHAYTLQLPDDTDQLESVEVQQLGTRIEGSTTAAVDFVARGTWVLSVDDRQRG